jgi:two-component system sensor histidine kinase KdpD
MLRSGHRNQLRFHGALLVAYVEQDGLRPEDQARLDSHLALARAMGAEVHCLKGGDFVDSILEFSHEQRITQVFLGHSGRDSRFGISRNPVDRLIEAAEDFDIRLFPHREDE